MSRRKQSNPKQFKQLDSGLQKLSEVKEPEETVDDDALHDSSLENGSPTDGELLKKEHSQDDDKQDTPGFSPAVEEEEWSGPSELKALDGPGSRRVCSCQALLLGTTWGPYHGKIETEKVPLALSDGPRWLADMTRVGVEDDKSNCAIYSKGGHVWCSVTMNIAEGDELLACVVDLQLHLQMAAQAPCVPGVFPARQLDATQLLPQQAAMASLLPGAVINKDIFPCQTCGIWFRSERNLQAHLMYYCSGRQKDSEMVEEKSLNVSHQMLLNGPHPQSNTCFVGSQALEMHLSAIKGLKSDEVTIGSNLKCTICGFLAETHMVLQNHILSHLNQTGLRCGHCHFTFQTLRELSKHQELHGHSINKLVKEEAICRLGGSPKQVDSGANIKDLQEPMEDSSSGQFSGPEGKPNSQKSLKSEKISGNQTLSYSKVKPEPSSPRLASSPIQNHLHPIFPITPFIPHVPFSQEVTVATQASEILAKMSELVHRRLCHKGSSYPPVVYNTFMPKGATCFECNITFNNLENYLVHKKHYCNGRWETPHKPHEFTGVLDKPAGTPSPKIGVNLVTMLNANRPSEVKSQESISSNPLAEAKSVDKLSEAVKKTSTPSGNQLDLQVSHNPESGKDPSQTTCEACKITFSRHETFLVHKQYYCATRHDPQLKRANNKASQKPIRQRKRRKAYEFTNAEQDQMPPMRIPSFQGMATLGGPYMFKDVMDNFREHQRSSSLHGLVPKYPEASVTISKSALVSKCNAVSRLDGETPIDLSTKCTAPFGNSPPSSQNLLDYHECVVCTLSFNKVEDYLKHKQSFCPGTIPQNTSTNGGIALNTTRDDSRNWSSLLENPFPLEFPAPHTKSRLPTAADIQVSGEDFRVQKRNDLKASQSSGSSQSAPKRMKGEEQIWPCFEINPTDYATGMLVTHSERRQSPNEGSEGEKDQPMPDGSHLSAENHSESTGDSLVPEKYEETDIRKLVSASPDITTNDCDGSPSQKTEVPTSIKRTLVGSPQTTGNIKYCRPCDIQFNNLSNFITHKKFYCSSHTAEHVK